MMNTPKEYSITIGWNKKDKAWDVCLKNEYGYELARNTTWTYAGAQRWARGAIRRDLKRGDRERASSYAIRPGVDDLFPYSDLIWAIATSLPSVLLSIALILYVIFTY